MKHKIRAIVLAITDICIFVGAWLLSIALSDVSFFEAIKSGWHFMALGAFFTVCINYIFGLYTKLWKYFDFYGAVKAIFASVFVVLYFCFAAIVDANLTLKWTVIASILYIPFFIASRFVIRFYYSVIAQTMHGRGKSGYKRVLIIGAGSAGSVLIREMLSSNKINMQPVCMLDDNPAKAGFDISGVKVVGKIKDVEEVTKKYGIDEIVIAIPSAGKKKISEIIKECQKTDCEIQLIPSVYQFITGKVSVSDIRKVNIQDLLGREQIKVNLDEIMGYIENKVILVTGGGGSIGSELCRQIATHNPKQLIIFDIYENNAYDIEQELKRKHPELNLVTLIGSVRDSVRVNKVFEEYKPQIVFHAAAHKHVPLMETSPNEAVKNNVSGTFKVSDAAGRNGAEKFILISTDKAVNPTNIMGATKRICEMIVQTMNKHYKTDYVAVRFGNVLGSNGSVIPLFEKQIKEGGPVTVTHKDIVRYFMTIPEAVSLVLQAGAYAKGGEIFVLDMGEQVKIYDMAINMIKLSGLEPFKDIDIKITGLRPGEKLYEERLMAEEGLQKTANKMISIGKPLDFDEENLLKKIKELYDAAYEETDKMKQLVAELVTTYKIDNKE